MSYNERDEIQVEVAAEQLSPLVSVFGHTIMSLGWTSFFVSFIAGD